MKTKFVLTTLSLVLASTAMVGCSKSDAPATGSKEALTAAAQNTFKAAQLPSIYENADYKDLALAADGPAQALIKAAKETKDVAKLTPYIKEFVQKRDEFLAKIPDQKLRMSAFQNFMQKNMQSAEDRKAYAEAMNAYYQVTRPGTGAAAKPLTAPAHPTTAPAPTQK